MKKRMWALLLALVMVLGALTACGKDNGKTDDPNAKQGESENKKDSKDIPSGGKVTHNLAADPKTIDPALNAAVDGHQVIQSVFEGLFRIDENEKAVPGIAEKYEVSEDGTKYTFHLRDAKWSDGQPIKASDFVFAWKRVLDPKTAAEYAYQMYYLKNAEKINKGELPIDQLGVKAVDDKTIEVNLEAPTAYFLELLAFPTYMPVREDIVTKDPEGWALNMATYIGNGPFKVKDWKHDDVMTLVKNENYYDADKVKLDEIDYVFIVEASTAFSAFQTGEIDYMESVPAEQIEKLKADKDPNFKIFPYLGDYFYCFNVNSEPVNKVQVRKALAYAIDRTQIVEKVTKAGQLPAAGFTPTGIPMSDGKDFQKTAGDYGMPKDGSKIEEAKKLLAEAGYPNGQGFPKIELLYNTGEAHKAIAEAIQAMWKENLGIEVELRNEEWKVFQTSRQNKQYTVARHGWIGDYVDPMTFLDMWVTGGGNNDAGYSNPKYDEQIQIAKTTTGEKRDKALLEAEKILMEDMPVMPIYYYTNAVLMRESIKNAPKSMLGPVNYREAYIQK